MSQHSRIGLTVASLCLAALTGCASNPVTGGAKAISSECPGYLAYKVLDRKVHLTPKQGESAWFTVTKITDSAIYGRGDTRYALSDIARLEVSEDGLGVTDVIDLAMNPTAFAVRTVSGQLGDRANRADCP